MSRIVTLTTDFGSSSVYVAEIKGRLLHAPGGCTLVDIAHDLPAHDIRAAAWLVSRACFAFPPGTLHLVVIDPGVGTARRMVWVKIDGHEFLAPDNGVLSLAIAARPPEAVRTLPEPADASATFHGRDVVAVAAGRLLAGEPPELLGREHGPLARFDEPLPAEGVDGLRGEVRFIDSFGNLITNLPADCWPRIEAAGGVFLSERPIQRVVRTYGDAPPGTAVVLVGSQGVVEIAVVEGSAARLLGGEIGSPVRIAAGGRA